MPHNLDRSDVDLTALATEIGERLGRPVALTARLPGQTDDDGTELPGTLLVADPDTGDELDVDGRTVADAVRAHIAPQTLEEQREELLAQAEQKAAAGDTAGALTDVLAMLRADNGA